MKIFLSWSGEVSKAVAIALREWLPVVLRDAAPWLSHTDIAAGERWSSEVAKELEASNFGIVCLTRDNLTAPWILFEAGAVAKKMLDGAVVPYLYGVEIIDIAGPLSQFQAQKADRDSTLGIIRSINTRSEKPEDVTILSKRFDLAWPDLEQKLIGIKSTDVKTQSPARMTNEILEEVLTVMRALEKRVGLVEVALRELEARPYVSVDDPYDLTLEGQSNDLVSDNAGYRVKQMRKMKEMTIKYVAGIARINPSTLVRIEDEQIKRPSLDVISRIANALGVPIDMFLTKEEK